MNRQTPFSTRQQVIIATAVFFCLAVAARLLPHPPNFTPVAAIALVAGAFLSGRRSIMVTVAAMALTDLVIGTYDLRIMAAVYLSIIAGAVIGHGLRARKSVGAMAVGSLASSVIFFLTTNAAVWAWSGLYPATADGLLRCYVAGLPFFRNTLAGDMFYALSVFGVVSVSLNVLQNSRTHRVVSVTHEQKLGV